MQARVVRAGFIMGAVVTLLAGCAGGGDFGGLSFGGDGGMMPGFGGDLGESMGGWGDLGGGMGPWGGGFGGGPWGDDFDEDH